MLVLRLLGGRRARLELVDAALQVLDGATTFLDLALELAQPRRVRLRERAGCDGQERQRSGEPAGAPMYESPLRIAPALPVVVSPIVI